MNNNQMNKQEQNKNMNNIKSSSTFNISSNQLSNMTIQEHFNETTASQTSINHLTQDEIFSHNQVVPQHIYSQDNLKTSQYSESETSRSSMLSQPTHSSQYSSDSERNVENCGYERLNQSNNMEIESEQTFAFEERKLNQTPTYQQTNQNSHLIFGDLQIDLFGLEQLLNQTENSGNQVDFSNSQINNWKKCTQIEKASSENGCFYISVDKKNEIQMSSIDQIREILSNLKERKLAQQNQIILSESEKFDVLAQKIERILENAERKRQFYFENYNSLEENDFSSQIFNKNMKSIKKTKYLMKNMVNANGSTNSFVFAQLKAFNPLSLNQEITQLIYSPKLIQILYGSKNTDTVFYNQVMRKGIIEMFDSNGRLILSELELPQIGRVKSNSNSESNGKVSLTLYTNDNFQIPITVTMKKFNLLEEEEVENVSVSGSHELFVFDIKIKIKYQKQLNEMRKSQSDYKVKKAISKNNSSSKASSNKKRNANFEQFNPIEEKSNQDELNQSQQEFFGYYLESLGFLNKFYPEKLSENEKFDSSINHSNL